MDLSEIRQKLAELSGLHHLVTDFSAGNYSDNGADFYINAGQKWLEGFLDFPKHYAEFSTTLAQGEFSKTLSSARSIQRIRVEETDEGVVYLHKRGLKQFREDWGKDDLLGSVDQDVPQDYTIGIMRDLSGTSATEKDKKLLIMPPANKAYTLFVEGKFYSEKLEADGDSNWWSVQFPDLLISAALYKHEVFMRNSRGLADWRNSILEALDHIEFDNIEESIAEIDQMNDAWDFRKNLVRRRNA